MTAPTIIESARPFSHTAMRPVGDFAVKSRGSVDPSRYPDEVFELFSIPAYDSRKPEVLHGSEIGSAKKVVAPGDVLISRIVPHIQRVWVVGPPNGHRQIASSEWIVFSHSETDPDYLRHMLLSKPFHDQFMQTVAGMGGSLLRARPSEVERIEIPVPSSRTEQRRIAAILDKADAIRRRREQALTLADDFLRSVFLEMFGDPLSNPKGWPVKTLGAHLEEIRYGTSEKCGDETPEQDIPVLRIPNVVNGVIDWTDLKFTSLNAKERERMLLHDGDILFVRTNGNPNYIGRCAVFEGNRPAAFASYLIRARLRDDAPVSPRFVSNCLSMPSYRSRMIQEAKTTAGNYNANTNGLRSLPIIEPPKEMQAVYARVVAGLNKTAVRIASDLTEANDLFASLSQQAFRGEL